MGFDPAFDITPSILQSISNVEAAKAVIENAPLLPLYERQFQSEATARKVHFSTAIEGNYLQIDEVKKIIGGAGGVLGPVDGSVQSVTASEGNVIARKRDIYEVINYRDVVKYIEDLEKSAKSGAHLALSENIIKSIHKMLMKGILESSAGKYRTSKAITVNFLTGEKHDPYESHGNIEGKMRELLDWYNSSGNLINPILRAGILHLEFVRIHPFEEGNGRTARSLATLSLSVNGYDVNHFFCLDEYYDSNAADYYQHLSDGFVDITKWLEYFAFGMAIEFNGVKDRVLKLSKDAKVKEKTGQTFISDRQEKIIEWLNTYGFFRNADFDELFPDISEDTVLRELKGLIEAGVIEKKGKTKSARYVLVE